MGEEILRSIGIDPGDLEDTARAYRVVIDSIAYILSTLGLDPTPGGVELALERVGLRIDRKALGNLIPELRARLGRALYTAIAEYQHEVPRLLKPGLRKRLAAYYTGPAGSRLMAALARRYLESLKRGSAVIADPFMGAGALLAEAFKALAPHRVERAWGVEKHPLACLVGYASLLGVAGSADIVDVRCGDAFELTWGRPLDKPFGKGPGYMADIVLTNPPFTRWESLEKGYRETLLRMASSAGYSRFIVRRQASLQAISLFLVDTVLSEGGVLAAVLPASTFYTIYGQGVKAMLRERYWVCSLVQGDSPAFSVDSGFKELILVAVKSPRERGGTAFITIERGEPPDLEALADSMLRASPPYSSAGQRVEVVDLHGLPHILDSNWLLLFEGGRVKRAVEAIVRGLGEGTLVPWAEALGRRSIVRGVEMYGPDFFLIPNRFWAVEQAYGEGVVIRSTETGEALEIGREYLVPSLRRPGLYVDRIAVEPGHYLVSIPPVALELLPGDLKRYIEWGVRSGAASPAVRTFGGRWYSHAYRQIQSKRPFGTLFLPDKVDASFRSRGVFAITSAERATATKNFYILVDRDYAEALALWFNSSLFLLLFILGSRKISEMWTRFLEEDYLNMPIPSPKTIENHLDEVITIMEELRSLRLPPLKHQLYRGYRYKVDMLTAKMLKAHDPEGFVEELHDLLAELLSRMP